MNCEQCAAPLVWTPGTDVLNCRFCGSYRQLRVATEFIDRLSPLGEPGDRNCPVCRTDLERAAIDRIPADYCPTCRGILLASDAFAIIVRDRRADFRGAERPPTPVASEKFAGRVECPKCSRSMERHCYGGPGNQVIDSCSRCDLVWLDCGELAAIETAPGRR